MYYESLSNEAGLDGLISAVRRHIFRLENTPFQPSQLANVRKHGLRVHLKGWLLKVINRNEDTL